MSLNIIAFILRFCRCTVGGFHQLDDLKLCFVEELAAGVDQSRPFLKELERVLQQLTDAGNSIVVIEHNLDLIKTADYLIDMGPEGGDGGGTVIAEGTPEKVADCKDSYTGYYIGKMLDKAKKNKVRAEKP